MVDFYGLMRKVPGGTILVPMILFAIINTIFPDLWTSLGGMSMALFKGGTQCLAGFLLFASGTSISVKGLGRVLKHSAPLAVAKLVISFVFGFAFLNVFGLDGIWGINGVAFVAVICACNPGVYMGCIQDYGEPADMANFAILNILTMPAIPIAILAAAGGSAFNVLDVVTILLPFLLGMLLGNLDPKIPEMFRAATPLALPFLGMCFGSSINLVSAVQAGIPGILLSIIYLVIHAVIMVAVDRLIGKQPGYAAMAMSSVAGIAVAVPAMLGNAYAPYVATATSEIALALIITSIVSPYLTRAVVNKWGAPFTFKKQREQAEQNKAASEGAKPASQTA